jgi:hypothetical protein
VVTVELADGGGVDEGDRQVAVVDPGGGERRSRRALQLLGSIDEVELDQAW